MPRDHQSHSSSHRDPDRSRSRDRSSSRSRNHDHHRDHSSTYSSSRYHTRDSSSDRYRHRHSSRDRHDASKSRSSRHSSRYIESPSRDQKYHSNKESRSLHESSSTQDTSKRTSPIESSISPKNTLNQIMSMSTFPHGGLSKTLETLAELEKPLYSTLAYPKIATPISPVPISPLSSDSIRTPTQISTTIIKPEATLLINKKEQSTKSVNPYLGNTSKSTQRSTTMMDWRLKVIPHNRNQTRGLQFKKQGDLSRKAKQDRYKFIREQISQTTKLQDEENAIQIENNYALEASTPNTTTNTTNNTLQEIKERPHSGTVIGDFILPPPLHSSIPQIEWWDRIYLSKELRAQFHSMDDVVEGVDYNLCSLDHCEVKDLIYHPVPIDRSKGDDTIILKPYLTKKERDRERRKNRAEKLEKQRLLIQAGIVPAPPPKLNMRNYKLVLRDEAIMNPTATEQKVRKEIEARKRAAQEENERRKLTPEERKDKRIKKIIGEKDDVVYVSVYRVNNLNDPKIKFKVSVNAKQLFLSGAALYVPSLKCCCIYVEGTKKAIRRYHKLMTRRIKWNGNDDENEDENENDDEEEENKETSTNPIDSENSCVTIWQGVVKSSHFKWFTYEQFDTPIDARKFMETKGLAQYWDSCVNYKPEVEALFD